MHHRRKRSVVFGRAGLGALLALAAAGSGPARAGDPAPHVIDEAAHDRAAVLAVDDHWGHAEMNGDTAYLERMLLPGYRSVDVDGRVRTKAAILASAARNRGSDAMRRKVAAWKRKHPSETIVVIVGDTAIVTFHDPASGPGAGVYSSDVFVYLEGRWHALYSQHSQAGKG